MKNCCRGCGSSETTKFLELKDYFLSQENFEIWECNECGLLFTCPTPTPSEIGKYYQSEDYLSHNETKKGIIPYVYNKVKRINNNNKFKISCGDLNKGNLLDIGCGVGDFLNIVQKNGWSIAGIEPNEKARNQAEQKLKISILKPEDINSLGDRQFDVVTMWHVLEHVADLKSELSNLNRLVKPDGKLIIAVPNYKSFDSIHYKDKWAAYDVPRHINHFSQTAMKNIFSTTSFELKKIEPLKWDSYFISMLSEKYLNNSSNPIKWIVNGWLSNRKAQTTGEFSSLVYIFKKTAL